MRHLLQFRAARSVCYALVVALLSTMAPTWLAPPARAQLVGSYAVVVTDFMNESGVQGDLLGRLATDAVHVELSKTSRYSVGFTRSDIKRQMDALDLHPPLDKLGLIRLGEALEADAVLEGSIKSVQIAGSGPTRRASVTLVVQMIDEASGEIVNGSVQTGNSSARVGYTADDDSLIAEAISNAAFLAVKTMVDYIIPEATVMVNIGENQVMLNKGVRDGLRPGMRMIVVRDREIIGYIELRDVSATDSIAKVSKSMRGIQPQDKARAIFEMPAVGSSLKSAPLPSGAPSGGRGGKSTFSKIAKFLVGAAIVFCLVSLVKGGRGSENAPAVVASPLDATTLTWNPNKYGHGTNVLEYQVLRDEFSDAARPVISIRDPSAIDSGRVDVAGLYGTAAAINVTFYRLDANPATTFTEATWSVPAEPFGTTHSYQVRVLYKLTSGTGTAAATQYFYTPVSAQITATAIEPVLNRDVVQPAFDPNSAAPEVLVSDLRDGTVNLSWNRKDGADIYFVRVEPVVPGTAPSFQSAIIYETGPTVQLPPGERVRLATVLGGSATFADQVMRWRVFCRHQADTSPAWVEGEENRFVIGGTPPVFP